MIKRCLIILSVIGFSMTQSYAQMYRWVDKDGQVHFTDNPSLIPADRLDQSQELSPEASQGQFSHTGTSAAPAAVTTETPPAPTSDEHLALQQEETEIEARIAAAQEERQHYLAQLNAMRPALVNPAFGGRNRRNVVEWGRSLAAVERQLDALHEELQHVQTKRQALERPSQPITEADSQAEDTFFDKQGHTRAYWRRRGTPLNERIEKAQARRQAILEQLSADPQTSIGAQRGREVLQLTDELEQVNQDLDSATTDLQNLKQDATRAGAPAAWIQGNTR
jgi:hypothetical protein